LYWLVVISTFFAMRFREVKGHWPLMKPKNKSTLFGDDLSISQGSGSDTNVAGGGDKKVTREGIAETQV
jgi:high-affinity iron transporter